jgi:hypothetical protein
MWPDPGAARLDEVVAELAARRSEGTWSGFTPPASFR